MPTCPVTLAQPVIQLARAVCSGDIGDIAGVVLAIPEAAPEVDVEDPTKVVEAVSPIEDETDPELAIVD